MVRSKGFCSPLSASAIMDGLVAGISPKALPSIAESTRLARPLHSSHGTLTTAKAPARKLRKRYAFICPMGSSTQAL